MANMLTNGGFEIAGSGVVFEDWDQELGTGTITQTDVGAEVNCGDYAAKLARGASGHTELSRDITVIPGRRYRVSAYTRGDGASGSAYFVAYDLTNAVQIGDTYDANNTTTSFLFFLFGFTAPAGCVSVRLFLRVSELSSTAYFDSVLMTKDEVFPGHFDNGISDETEPYMWYTKTVAEENRITLVDSPNRHPDHQAIRVEIQTSDPNGTGRQRTEIKNMKDQDGQYIQENENSGTQFYGFSVMLQAGWTSTGWAFIMQLHPPDAIGGPPAFSIQATDRFFLDCRAGNVTPPSPWPYDRLEEFSDNRLCTGHWVDFVIGIMWVKTATGFIKVWRRDEGETFFKSVVDARNVPTFQWIDTVEGSEVGHHYWNCGVYRSTEAFTNVLWLSGMCRGPTFDWVVERAFPMQPIRRRGRGTRR